MYLMQSCEDVANLALSLHSDLVATRDEWGVPDTAGMERTERTLAGFFWTSANLSEVATLHLHVGQAAARASSRAHA